MNNKRVFKTIEEKEKIVKEYLSGETMLKIASKYNMNRRVIYKWVHKYEKEGIQGLKRKCGPVPGSKRNKYYKPKTEEEKLKQIILKKDIEIERLKKGYLVKGGGDQKEFVTIFDVNTK